MQKRGYNPRQRERRIKFMTECFPEAMVGAPIALFESFSSLPDPNDRHVIAAAVNGRAHAIVTLNRRHFPAECLARFDILCHTPDEFLIHLPESNSELVLEKIDAQAKGVRQSVAYIVERLAIHAPEFSELITQ